jgi:hypothetical protein
MLWSSRLCIAFGSTYPYRLIGNARRALRPSAWSKLRRSLQPVALLRRQEACCIEDEAGSLSGLVAVLRVISLSPKVCLPVRRGRGSTPAGRSSPRSVAALSGCSRPRLVKRLDAGLKHCAMVDH